ncbi:hypothetical protein A4G19_04655 [Pasteurellaceae bacterium Macca]|nr:hypothetical protein [Pasteurellaceae bacterium Macca]
MNVSDFLRGDNYEYKIYLYPKVPKDKAKNVINAFNSKFIQEYSDIEVLIDGTLFGSAKKGIVITNKIIAIRTLNNDNIEYKLSEIKEIYVKKGILDSKLFINGVKVAELTQPYASLKRLFSKLNQYILDKENTNKEEDKNEEELKVYDFNQEIENKVNSLFEATINIYSDSVILLILAAKHLNNNKKILHNGDVLLDYSQSIRIYNENITYLDTLLPAIEILDNPILTKKIEVVSQISTSFKKVMDDLSAFYHELSNGRYQSAEEFGSFVNDYRLLTKHWDNIPFKLNFDPYKLNSNDPISNKINEILKELEHFCYFGAISTGILEALKYRIIFYDKNITFFSLLGFIFSYQRVKSEANKLDIISKALNNDSASIIHNKLAFIRSFIENYKEIYENVSSYVNSCLNEKVDLTLAKYQYFKDGNLDSAVLPLLELASPLLIQDENEEITHCNWEKAISDLKDNRLPILSATKRNNLAL